MHVLVCVCVCVFDSYMFSEEIKISPEIPICTLTSATDLLDLVFQRKIHVSPPRQCKIYRHNAA